MKPIVNPPYVQEQTIRNISALLDAANSSLKRIIKVNVYLTTMDNFGPMNEGYAKFFSAPFPVSCFLRRVLNGTFINTETGSDVCQRRRFADGLGCRD